MTAAQCPVCYGRGSQQTPQGASCWWCGGTGQVTPPSDPATQATVDLRAAIVGWHQAAERFHQDGNRGTATACEKAVRSLLIELVTGTAVCSCCYQPRRP